MRQRFWLLCLLFLLLGFTIIPRLSQAQSIGLDSRISRLEAEIFQLRSRLSNLESQRSPVDRSASNPPPSPTIPSSPRQTTPPSPAMFDRLATLTIELKERVQTLEQKVAALEKKQNHE